MSAATVLILPLATLVLLAAVLILGAGRRRETDAVIGVLDRAARARDRGRSPSSLEPAPSGRDVERAAAAAGRAALPEEVAVSGLAPIAWAPPDDETLGVTRRQFLNRSIVGAMGLSATGFGLSALAFLWPQGRGGFGSKIRVGSLADVNAAIADGDGFAFYSEGRMWITEYPAAALDRARRVYAPSVVAGIERGIAVLYQRCPHLGCRVPQCLTSQWFECPCHGSQYKQAGEKKGGPAPRGMDRFPLSFFGDTVVVDTGTIIQGPPIDTNTTGQEAEGPHCVGGGE